VPRSFPDGAAPHAAAQALVYNGASAGAAMATSTSSSERTGTHLVTLAASNFLGPLLLGRFFDTIGRRTMITATYGISGVLLIATAVAFGLDAFSAWGQTFAWMLIFFFASAAASSAYLTAREIFPWRRGRWRSPSFMPWARRWAARQRRSSSAISCNPARPGRSRRATRSPQP
jgi:MFS family permease